jgi:hypothetical protein
VLISVNGWGRDHGTKEIIEGDLMTAEVGASFPTEIGVQIAPTNVVISKRASLRLNGDYVVRAELSQSEIARLFFLTHSNKELFDLVGIFAEFKQEQDKADAQRQAAEDAKKRSPIRRRF